MRVMLDTNVLISALVFPTERMNTLIYKAALDYQLVLSSYIIDELVEVTERKFPTKVYDVNLFLTRFPYELVYTPKEQKPDFFAIRDIDDYPVLYSAIVEDIDLFVTGDDDFKGVVVEKPVIITPAEFLENY
jgi:putative PIN family toxin of toxin-antitoxin system